MLNLFAFLALSALGSFCTGVIIRSGSLKMSAKDVLIDMPVSNHGARIRMILKAKQIEGSSVELKQPADFGGLKSEEYLRMNPQGKMPMLIVGDNDYPIPESDAIARFIISKYTNGPSFIPQNPIQECLSNQIIGFHDVYISCIQSSMYKAPGTPFSAFGIDRKAALGELRKQYVAIESLLDTFCTKFPDVSSGPFLCGEEIALADATLFPTMVFSTFMLPEILGTEGFQASEYFGPRLLKWWQFMTNDVPEAIEVRKELENSLEKWKGNGRFLPIFDELRSAT